jgi:ABC-type transport system involved in multi-copper enzyme maturation permease subunit
MIFSIALKDFLGNFVSARFIIGFILCLILIPFTVVIGIQEYKSRQSIYEVEKNEANESMNVTVYSALRPVVVKPPEPLSVFSRGISNNVGNRVKIYLGTIPLLAEGRTSVRDNPLLNTLFTLDFCSVMAIIMSLLAFVFSYDACSGEREQGTLKLIMSQSISRSKYLMGKIAGVFLTILPIILFCYILSFIIVMVFPGISFSANEWSRIIVLFLLSIVYFTLFIALGIFISSRFKSSVTSIIVCLFVWITMLFVIPSFSVYIARSFVTVRPREILDLALRDIDRERERKAVEYRNTLDKSKVWFSFFNQYSLRDDGYCIMKGTSKGTYEYFRQANEALEPMRIEYAGKKWQLQKSYLDELENQRRFSERLSSISPSEIFRFASSSLCRVDANSQNSYLERTRRYREELITFFKDEKIFGSFLYFTPLSPEIFVDTDELIRITTNDKMQNLEELEKWSEGRSDKNSIFTKDRPEWMAESPLIDISNVPIFQWQPDTITDSIQKSIGKLGAMIVIAILLFYLSFVSFTRYDVR